MHTQEAYTFKRYVPSGSRQRLVVQATASDAARNGAITGISVKSSGSHLEVIRLASGCHRAIEMYKASVYPAYSKGIEFAENFTHVDRKS